MAYEPTVWKSGDVVTSAKLNKMEQGIAAGGGGNVLVAHATVALADVQSITPGNPIIITLDKTYAELSAAEDSIVVVDMTAGDITAVTATFRPACTLVDSGTIAYTVDRASDFFLDGEPYDVLVAVNADGNMLLTMPVSSGEPFVLHGTLTSATGGTITEVPQDLMDAITANKRIIAAITMPTASGTADYNVECTVTKVENSKPYAYGTCSTDGSTLLAIYIGEVNDSLAFEAGQYTLTPYSP